ncbi:MAG: hypothetical protein HYX24_04770 [Candidatus Aenigmarchaeota archaeon]|nr:hypothetical protein [Candidatus Aenigmarchaeota archaeon]
MLPYPEIVSKLSDHAKLTTEEIDKMVTEKQEELSGLVSREGAAYIVSRELGLNLIKEETKRELKIKHLVSGLYSVTISPTVISVFEPRAFDKNGRKGQVANILVGDETGSCRLSLWNDEVEKLKELSLQPGDVIELRNGYVKVDNTGMPELRIGRGMLKKLEGVSGAVSNIQTPFSLPSGGRNHISDLKENSHAEIRAAVVQIFSRQPFYEVCPQCGSRLTGNGVEWTCSGHGAVKPSYNLILSGFADDGTGTIRAVFFRNAAERLIGKTTEEVLRTFEEKKDIARAFNSEELIGKDYIIRGRVKRSEFTGDLEMLVSDAEPADPKKEALAIISRMEKKE